MTGSIDGFLVSRLQTRNSDVGVVSKDTELSKTRQAGSKLLDLGSSVEDAHMTVRVG